MFSVQIKTICSPEQMMAEMKTYRESTRTSHEEIMTKLDVHHERVMACLEKTGATILMANPEEMQSEAVQREVPKEDAAVETGRAQNKRHRDRHLPEKRHGQPEERTRGNCESRKKLTAPGRTMTLRAGVAQRKGNIVGKSRTRDNVV
jgi:hypothetical protein